MGLAQLSTALLYSTLQHISTMAGKQARIRAKERRKAKPYDKANSTPAAALGEDGQALYDAGQEANKDDDELELEALLFGKKMRSKNAPIVMPGAGEEDIGELVEDSTLGHLADQEVRLSLLRFGALRLT